MSDQAAIGLAVAFLLTAAGLVFVAYRWGVGAGVARQQRTQADRDLAEERALSLISRQHSSLAQKPWNEQVKAMGKKYGD